MSHRVTTQTEIKDKALAVAALKSAGMSFTERGDTLTIIDGRMRGASIDLRTGMVTGDSDYHNRDDLGALRQHYGEQKYRKECLFQGITITGREVLANGDVKLYCNMA